MKFSLLCLLLGIGLTQLSAQNNGDNNKAVIDIRYFSERDYGIVCDLYNCSGEKIVISGIVTFYGIKQPLRDEEGYRYIFHLKGEVKSSDGEVFQVHHNEINDNDGGEQHFNLIGDQGSHYLGSITFVEWIPIVNKLVCIENGKE